MTEVSDEINEFPFLYKVLAHFRAGALQSDNVRTDSKTEGKENAGANGVQPSTRGETVVEKVGRWVSGIRNKDGAFQSAVT